MMGYDDPRGTPYSRFRYCYMTEQDERAFTAILKDEFPGILIFTVDPDKGRLVTYDTIADVSNSPSIYLPESGWKPRFEQHSDCEGDYFRLVNRPESSILIYRARIRSLNMATLPRKKPRPPSIVIQRFEGEGSIQGHYFLDQPDVKRFVFKVFRLIGKFMSNSREIVDLKTREIIRTEHGSDFWAGPDAVRRCREEENFFMEIGFSFNMTRWIGMKAIPKPAKAKPKRRRAAG